MAERTEFVQFAIIKMFSVSDPGPFCPDPDQTFFPKSGSGSELIPDPEKKSDPEKKNLKILNFNFFSFLTLS
jgi:hypothetical protein